MLTSIDLRIALKHFVAISSSKLRVPMKTPEYPH